MVDLPVHSATLCRPSHFHRDSHPVLDSVM